MAASPTPSSDPVAKTRPVYCCRSIGVLYATDSVTVCQRNGRGDGRPLRLQYDLSVNFRRGHAGAHSNRSKKLTAHGIPRALPKHIGRNPKKVPRALLVGKQCRDREQPTCAPRRGVAEPTALSIATRRLISADDMSPTQRSSLPRLRTSLALIRLTQPKLSWVRRLEVKNV